MSRQRPNGEGVTFLTEEHDKAARRENFRLDLIQDNLGTTQTGSALKKHFLLRAPRIGSGWSLVFPTSWRQFGEHDAVCMPIGFLFDQVYNASGGFFAAHISANHDLLGRIQNGSEFDRGTESGDFDYPRFSTLMLTASCSPRDMNGDRCGTANSASRAFGVHVMRPCRGASCAYVNTALSVWVVLLTVPAARAYQKWHPIIRGPRGLILSYFWKVGIREKSGLPKKTIWILAPNNRLPIGQTAHAQIIPSLGNLQSS